MGIAENTKYATIDEYISGQSFAVQEILRKIRDVIRENAPNATERMSWQMPTYWERENLIHFAAAKNHIGIYPGAEGVAFFADRLSAKGYKFSKGAIQFPLSKPIDYDLIAEIIQHRVSVVEK